MTDNHRDLLDVVAEMRERFRLGHYADTSTALVEVIRWADRIEALLARETPPPAGEAEGGPLHGADRITLDEVRGILAAPAAPQAQGECLCHETSSRNCPVHQNASEQQAQGWRPIESAPKDGTRILLWVENWIVASWGWPVPGPADAGEWQIANGATWPHEGPYAPTHWMPLPPPPQGCANERDCTMEPWCRIDQRCHKKSSQPVRDIRAAGVEADGSVQQREVQRPAGGMWMPVDAVALAYGCLWHVHNDDPSPHVTERFDPFQAAFKARHILRDYLNKEQQRNGIIKAKGVLPPAPSASAEGRQRREKP